MLFRPVQIQLALFLSSVDISSRLRLASQVHEALPQLGGVDPLLLPLPPEVPNEFPVILIENERTGWAFQLSPSRADVVVNLRERTDVSEVVAILADGSIKLWNVLESEAGARGFRLGLVGNFLAETDDAANLLRSRYLLPTMAEGAKEVQIHYLQTVSENGFDLNIWVRLRSQTPDVNASAGVALLLDINTMPEHPLERLDNGTILRFFESANRLYIQNIDLHSRD